MGILYENNASTTVNAAVNPGDGTITIATGTVIPAITAPDYAYATIQDSSGDYEIVKITAHTLASTTVTVDRGQDGTAAGTWAIGDIFEMRLTKVMLEEFRDHNHTGVYAPAVHNHDSAYINAVGDTMTGDLTLSNPIPANDDSTKAAYTSWINDNYNFYDVGGAASGIVLNSSEVLIFIFPRSVTFQTTGDLSIAECGTGPTNTVVFDIQRDGVNIGDITFTTSATTGTVTWDATTTYTAGQQMKVVAPANTFSMQDFTFTLAGSLNF